MDLTQLKKKLKQQNYQDIHLQNYIPSAVLVPLIVRKNQWTLLLTQRSERVKDHKKQICFPGGMKEPGDSEDQITALRETHEELGISQERIEILGRLSQHFTPTRYYITPFVGVVKTPLRLSPNPSEINQVLEVPLEHFKQAEHIQLQKAEFFSKDWNLPFYRYKNFTIWGVTGRIISELVQRISGVKDLAHFS